jgi:hypothetical protein
MNGAGSKAKGGDYERSICKRLSRWLTRGMRDDLFWRSAMSGGRATVRFKQGAKNRTQAGDITAIDPLGERLTSLFLIECKSYRDLNLNTLLRPLQDCPKDSCMHRFWETCRQDAIRHGKLPLLIGKQNLLGEVLIVDSVGRDIFGLPDPPTAHYHEARCYLYWFPAFLALARRP